MTKHPTKAAARAHVKAAGYTVLDSISASGDHGYGSREYYAKPDAPKNQHGATMGCVAISKMGREWYAGTI